MAQYNIQFSSNASAITKQLSQLQVDIARIGASRPDIKLNLEPLKRGLSETKTAVVDLNNEYQKLGQTVKTSLNAQNNAIASQGSATRGLTSEIGKLAAAYFTVQTAQKAFQAGIRRTESERRITALSRAFGEVAETQEAAARAAQRFGLSQSEANAAFAQIYARLRPIGIGLSDIESSFNGFNTAAKLSGASVQEASSAWLQLSQALGSGVLRGEELNSVFEQTPGVVQAIAREMGVPIGQIRDLASDGEITSDIVIRALKRIETEGADQLAEAMKGPAQQVKNLQNEFENFQVAATKDLLPAVIDIVKELKNVLESLAPVIRGLGSLAAQTLGSIADLVNAATKPGAYAAAVSIRSGRLPLGMGGAAELFKETSGTGGAGLAGLIEEAKELSGLRRQSYNEVLLGLMQDRLKTMEPPATTARPVSPPDSTSPPSLTGSTEEQSKKQKKEQEGFERLRDQLANAYNKAEIERIKTRYELEKRLREDLFSVQEFGANRLQRQNLQFLRALVSAEQDRFEANLNAQLNIAQEAGKVDQSAAITAASGGESGSISIVEFGKALQQMGFTVREHPEFGGVGRHSQNSYHYSGEALDITDHRPGDWMGRTKELGEALRQSGSAAEIFHPGYDPVGGHDTHVHAAFRGGRVPLTPGIQSLMQGQIGAGAPRRVEGSESRQTMAAAQTDIARSAALETERASALMKSSAQLRELARYTQQAYNIPDLLLDTQLQKKRNDLLEEGADEDIINYRLRLYEIDLQRQHLLKVLPQFIKDANMSEQDRVNMEELLAKAFDAAKEAERQKNDETERGSKIRSGIEVKEYIDRLRDEIALLQAATEAERQRLQIQQDYPAATPEQQLQIINLQETKKDLEEVRRAIDDLVSSTVSDYKGFFKSVLFGEDPVEALKEFQKRLADKTLTLFLDFAMAPVEQFFKENLFNLFKPEESKEVAAATSNTSALGKNTAAIEANTAAQGGQAPTSAMTNVPGVGNTPTSSLFSMGGLGSQAVNAPMAIDIAAFGGASSAIDSLNESVYSMGSAIPSFKDSLGNITDTVYKASEETNAQGATFSEGLGKAVGAIGIAATSVMGIAAGISQIKEGGASNVLGGIGSVLMGVGGAMGGFGKLFGANGGVAAGGWKPFPVSAFANGGVVNGPTLGLVGEGKFNEAIVPLPDGRSIPVKMAGSQSPREAMETGGMSSASNSSVLSLSFETTNIGGVEYVSRDQLELAMAATRKEATREGATRGMNMTIDKIKNSPSTRNSLGIGRR
jgi:tape measure domain-containing protein